MTRGKAPVRGGGGRTAVRETEPSPAETAGRDEPPRDRPRTAGPAEGHARRGARPHGRVDRAALRAPRREAIIAWDSYNPLSLDAPAEGASETDTGLIVDRLGAEDPDLQHVVERKTLWSLLGELPERQRTIVLPRFFGNQTQTQIAERFGISQMHVSRLLGKSLLQPRHGMLPA